MRRACVLDATWWLGRCGHKHTKQQHLRLQRTSSTSMRSSGGGMLSLSCLMRASISGRLPYRICNQQHSKVSLHQCCML